MRIALAVLLLFIALAQNAPARDWPTVRGDVARSGYTSESLSTDLSLRWKHKPLHALPFDKLRHR